MKQQKVKSEKIAESHERLQKIIARSGLASRREAEKWIREKRVTVNSAVVSRLGFQADPTRDKIKVDGRLLPPPSRHQYYVFHKPAGLITSIGDPEDRPNLGGFLKSLHKGERLCPVGRLDYNSSGILLLTSHGELTHRLSHPRYRIKRVYQVKISGFTSEKELGRLRTGIRLKDGVAKPDRVKILKKLKQKSWLEVELREGRYREVRRMFEALGHSVERLVRTSFGPIRLGTLPQGEIRPLSPDEIRSLFRAANLQTEDFKKNVKDES
jgi:23S rRNA pseudouridine2605 synthase